MFTVDVKQQHNNSNNKSKWPWFQQEMVVFKEVAHTHQNVIARVVIRFLWHDVIRKITAASYIERKWRRPPYVGAIRCTAIESIYLLSVNSCMDTPCVFICPCLFIWGKNYLRKSSHQTFIINKYNQLMAGRVVHDNIGLAHTIYACVL